MAKLNPPCVCCHCNIQLNFLIIDLELFEMFKVKVWCRSDFYFSFTWAIAGVPVIHSSTEVLFTFAFSVPFPIIKPSPTCVGNHLHFILSQHLSSSQYPLYCSGKDRAFGLRQVWSVGRVNLLYIQHILAPISLFVSGNKFMVIFYFHVDRHFCFLIWFIFIYVLLCFCRFILFTFVDSVFILH